MLWLGTNFILFTICEPLIRGKKKKGELYDPSLSYNRDQSKLVRSKFRFNIFPEFYF